MENATKASRKSKEVARLEKKIIALAKRDEIKASILLKTILVGVHAHNIEFVCIRLGDAQRYLCASTGNTNWYTLSNMLQVWINLHIYPCNSVALWISNIYGDATALRSIKDSQEYRRLWVLDMIAYWESKGA